MSENLHIDTCVCKYFYSGVFMFRKTSKLKKAQRTFVSVHIKKVVMSVSIWEYQNYRL